MIVVRKDSPLVIGKGNGENYISSDIPAILSFTREFYLLEDLEFVVLSRDDAKFYDKNLNPIDKKFKRSNGMLLVQKKMDSKIIC